MTKATEDLVRAWWKKHPEIKTLENATRMMWLETNFTRLKDGDR